MFRGFWTPGVGTVPVTNSLITWIMYFFPHHFSSRVHPVMYLWFSDVLQMGNALGWGTAGWLLPNCPALSSPQRTCSFGGFDLTNRSLHVSSNNSDPTVSIHQRKSQRFDSREVVDIASHLGSENWYWVIFSLVILNHIRKEALFQPSFLKNL